MKNKDYCRYNDQFHFICKTKVECRNIAGASDRIAHQYADIFIDTTRLQIWRTETKVNILCGEAQSCEKVF